MLSEAQRQAFIQDGFLAAPGTFAAEAARIARWTDEVLAAPEVPGRHAVYRELNLVNQKTELIARIENLCTFHAELDAFCRGEVCERVTELFGEPAVLFMDKINFKQPGGSNGWRPHQDQDPEWGAYCPLFVTAAIAIDPSSADNGCLQMARGQHLKSFATGAVRLLTKDEMEAMRFEPVPMAPGDAVFFSSYTPHWSAPNLSATPRRLLYLTYNRASDGDHRVAHFAQKRIDKPPDADNPGARVFHRRQGY